METRGEKFSKYRKEISVMGKNSFDKNGKYLSKDSSNDSSQSYSDRVMQDCLPSSGGKNGNPYSVYLGYRRRYLLICSVLFLICLVSLLLMYFFFVKEF